MKDKATSFKRIKPFDVFTQAGIVPEKKVNDSLKTDGATTDCYLHGKVTLSQLLAASL
jgi:hypothetical protein